MNIAQALKKKNRLAGEIRRQEDIMRRENSRREDTTSTVDRESVITKILDLKKDLVDIKTKIAKANVNIYQKIEEMVELKSYIGMLKDLPKRDDVERIYVGDKELHLKWTSYITEGACDDMLTALQKSVDTLQDEIDDYNASTQVD